MRKRGGLFGVVACGLLGTAACGDEGALSPVPPASPPFDAAWRISTHNSYWVDHGVMGDVFASGTQERLADQLLVDHARGVEIDIHQDPSPHAFDVFHTLPGNVLCNTLPGCLGELRAFHHALPQHEVLHVTLELKQITASLFDADHTIEDLDAVLSGELGDLLYRPADLMARCPGESTLSGCVKAAGWPSTHELRGRIVVSPLGNWDAIGAQATKDYIDYATHGDIRDRSGFPIASSWQLDHEALSGPIYELVTQADIDAAFAQSIFMQVEDVTDPNMPPFLARHGVVRLDNAVSAADQEARVALGAQLLQTDSPWVQLADRGPSQPLRSMVIGFGEDAMTEPGGRLALGPGAPGEWVFAYRKEDPSAATAWEAMVSSGVDATRVGCLRAASALGSDDGSVTVCRSKIPASRGAAPGTSDGGAPDAETAVLTVRVCLAGEACATTRVSSNDPVADGPGDLIRIEVANQPGGTSCVLARSAATAGTDLAPRWQDLGPSVCFPVPLVYQGILTPTEGFFFGTRRQAGSGGVLADVSAADFAGVIAGGADDAGTYHEAVALLVDSSSH